MKKLLICLAVLLLCAAGYFGYRMLNKGNTDVSASESVQPQQPSSSSSSETESPQKTEEPAAPVSSAEQPAEQAPTILEEDGDLEIILEEDEETFGE